MLNYRQYIIDYIISIFVEAFVSLTHTLVFCSNKRSSPAIIDHDIRKRLFCCILIDGDIIV